MLNSTLDLISVFYKTNDRTVFILLLFLPEFAGSNFVDNRILMEPNLHYSFKDFAIVRV